MVEIIAFPGRSSSSVVDTSKLHIEGAPGFVQPQVIPVPQVGTTLDGTVVVSAPKQASAFPDGDWTNQELADLYRVESLLVQAGIKLSTGRGVTDENDPWFVFCREDGDVFVHLARADGRYLLDSPGLSGLLEGPDFPALIDKFVAQLAALRQPEADGNIISFRPKMLRDKSIHLHPSVLLAALIWTLYLASDDIVSATEAAGELAEDAILPVDQLLDLDQIRNQDPAEEDAAVASRSEKQDTKTGEDNQTANPGFGYQDGDRSGSSSDRLVASFGAMAASTSPAAQAVSASLAIIAFSFGFYGPQSGSDTGSETNTEFSIAGLHSALRELAESASVSIRADLEQIPGDIQTGFDAAPVVLENLDGVTQPNAAEVVDIELHLKDLAAETANTSLPDLDIPVEEGAEAVAESNPPSSTDAAQTVSYQEDQTVTAQPPASQPAETATVSAPAADNVQETVDAAEQITLVDSQPLVSYIFQNRSDVAEFTVGDLTVSTSLDEASLDRFLDQMNGEDGSDDLTGASGGLADLEPDDLDTALSHRVSDDDNNSSANKIDEPAMSIMGAEISEYTASVEQFVWAFSQRVEDPETLFFQNELVILDKSAANDLGDRPYVRSWLTDDVLVISTIGHYQVFFYYGRA